jgi:anti-sigma B factor antagonist
VRIDESRNPPPIEQLITISTEWTCGAAVLGEVDLLTVPRLRAELDTVMSRHARPVVLDMAHVRLLSPDALIELARVAALGRERGEPLRVVVDERRPVLRPIQLTGLDQVLALCASVDEALGVLE